MNKEPLKAHRNKFWNPNIPGHKQRREGVIVRGRQLVESLERRTEVIKQEFGLGYNNIERK